MSRKLFLTSTGLNPELRDDFKDFIGKPFDGLTVAFIPTAADPEKNKWFVKAARDGIEECGMNVLPMDLKEETELSLQEKFSHTDIIFINGGNTYYLLDWARKTGLNKILPRLLDQGKIYVGVSAGSILVGPSIAMSFDKNIAGLTDLRGLQIVSFVVSPHYVESERKDIIKMRSQNFPHQIIAITDDQAIAVNGNSWKLVGKGNLVIFGEPH